MIAVSLNVGGGVHLFKPTKLCMCMQNTTKHNEDGRTAPGVCGNGSVPLSHSGNVVARIGTHTNLSISLDTKGLTSPLGHKTPISDLTGCSCVEEFTCIMIDGKRGLIFININN